MYVTFLNQLTLSIWFSEYNSGFHLENQGGGGGGGELEEGGIKVLRGGGGT